VRNRTVNGDNPRKYGDAAEKRIAKDGYRRTPGSGSAGMKGDLRRADMMVEVKRTKHSTFNVTPEIMAKLRNDTLTNGARGVLIVVTGNGDEFAVMPRATFEALVPDDD